MTRSRKHFVSTDERYYSEQKQPQRYAIKRCPSTAVQLLESRPLGSAPEHPSYPADILTSHAFVKRCHGLIKLWPRRLAQSPQS